MTTAPSSRSYPFLATAGDFVYIWGGQGDPEPEIVSLCHREKEKPMTWTRQVTKGPHPPAGQCRRACTASGRYLYLYVGCAEAKGGTLCRLNTETWEWCILCEDVDGGPGKVTGCCGMILYQDFLLVVGRQTGCNARTNAVHRYSLITGLWSYPSNKGSRPPLCETFSLTRIDEEKAVMFGGYILSGRSMEAHILQLPTMTWTEHKKRDPWPEERLGHIAACLGYGGQYQRLLVSGGWDGIETHDDMWLLDPKSGKMEEVQVPETHKKLIQKYEHGATALIINSDCVEVILFGGRSKEGFLRAETVVLRFELQKSLFRGGKWSLVDIADHTQFLPANLATTRMITESSYKQGNMDDTMRRLEQQLQESRFRELQLQTRTEELQTLADQSIRTAEASQRQAEDSDQRAETFQRRAENSHRLAEEFQRRAEDAEERLQHLERSQGLRLHEDCLEINSTHWEVRREEIELTGPELGVGGWATVTVAKFRGTQVAVKRIHDEIICRHNLQLFQREMNMAARLRHPNLIQFIGATMEGEMMIVMELMTTSLRTQLKKEEYFSSEVVKAISLDVARGLNYLHLIEPDPIVHRDISSANVLLEELAFRNWRAKVTDYGSVNLVRQFHTVNPGSPVYAAPEALNPRLQSPMMDIYSFGALVLEMLTGRLPAPEDRPGMLGRIQHKQLLCLIRRCLSVNPEDRPSASDIISNLNA